MGVYKYRINESYDEVNDLLLATHAISRIPSSLPSMAAGWCLVYHHTPYLTVKEVHWCISATLRHMLCHADDEHYDVPSVLSDLEKVARTRLEIPRSLDDLVGHVNIGLAYYTKSTVPSYQVLRELLARCPNLRARLTPEVMIAALNARHRYTDFDKSAEATCKFIRNAYHLRLWMPTDVSAMQMCKEIRHIKHLHEEQFDGIADGKFEHQLFSGHCSLWRQCVRTRTTKIPSSMPHAMRFVSLRCSNTGDCTIVHPAVQKRG
jgi:hypothetical protein